MRYDFDLFYVDNAPNREEAICEGAQSTLRQSGKNTVFAVFRDKTTINAAAPAIVRLFLEEAGFGVRETTQRADAESAAIKRKILIQQMTSVLSNRAMKKALGRVANEGAFNVHDFIAFVIANEAPALNLKKTNEAPRNKVMPRRAVDVRLTGARRRVRPS